MNREAVSTSARAAAALQNITERQQRARNADAMPGAYAVKTYSTFHFPESPYRHGAYMPLMKRAASPRCHVMICHAAF